MWSCAEDSEQFVNLWVPTLLAQGWPAVRAALIRDADIPPDQLPWESVCVGVAAADIVGGARGSLDPEMPEDVAAWLKANTASLDPALVPLALAAVERAIAYYADIWGEGDESLGCQTAAKELCLVLGGAPDEDDAYDPPER